jgi:hypothetical protein
MTSTPEWDRPCGWPDPTPVACSAWTSATQEVRDWAAGVAAGVLWALSGRRFGVCSTTAWPASPARCEGLSTYTGPVLGRTVGPVLVAGAWTSSGCGCGPVCQSTQVRLPGPVVEVTEVTVDGAVLDPSDWRVGYGGVLIRTDGLAWPAKDNALAVTYTKGVALDGAALSAYAGYACELAKSKAGDSSCKLPQRIQSLTREGVTVAFTDPMEFLDHGRTGVPEVDLWLAAVNPDQLRQPSGVYSPDWRPQL